MNTTSAASLLPPFEPLPSLAATFQTTPSSPSLPDYSPLPSRSASPTPFTTPTPSTLPSPQPSPSVSNAFFARLRSNSFHNSAFPSSASTSAFRRQRECSPPPVPSISSTPRNSRIVSNSSCKLSPPSVRNTDNAPALPSVVVPLIKSVTVPHHSKSGKNWLFACRVVPVSAAAAFAVEGKGKARVYGLGKMEMANDHEPYTIYRSWSECVEFSSRLAQMFPDDRQAASGSRTDLFNHQVPRLSRKLVLFMTRSTLEARQAELDLFCRRLFQMSGEIRDSLVVRSFFGLKNGGGLGTIPFDPAILSDIPIPPIPVGESDSDDKNATIKPKPKPQRPALSVKISTPNLRSVPISVDANSEALSPETMSSRAIAANRAFTVDATDLRATSELSIASAATLTPFLYTAQNSPALSPATPNQEGKFKTLRKKASGPLRHFRSLQDLRGGANSSLEVPDAPVPRLGDGLAAPPMFRNVSQPMPRALPSPLHFGAPIRLTPGPTSAPIRPSHRRTGSSTSSISSTDGDLWGTSYFVPAPTSFRQTPTGRLESVPLQQSQSSYSSSSHHRRHAGGGGGGSISTQKASLGHSSSASISSLDSLRSSTSESGSGSRSARHSFDWGATVGDGFGLHGIETPPTPQSPWAQKDGAFTPSHNLVPPPPFFPVPPAMTSAFSHDGLSHAPRAPLGHKSSLECSTSSGRSRTDSTASRRLDSLTASPSAASSCSSPGIGGPDPRPQWTFKLLHADENVVLRIARDDLSLDRLRIDTRAKFKAAGVDLSPEGAHWGLSYTDKPGPLLDEPFAVAPTSRLIITEHDLEQCLARVAAGKVTLKVVT